MADLGTLRAHALATLAVCDEADALRATVADLRADLDRAYGIPADLDEDERGRWVALLRWLNSDWRHVQSGRPPITHRQVAAALASQEGACV